MTPKKNPIAGEPLSPEEVYSKIIYDAPHGSLRVLPAWGQKSVPETYFRKLSFKNLAPTKRSNLVNPAHDPKEDETKENKTDFEGFLDDKSDTGGTIATETANMLISSAGSEDGLHSPGVAGTPPANTGGAGVDPPGDVSKPPSKEKLLEGEAKFDRLMKALERNSSAVESLVAKHLRPVPYLLPRLPQPTLSCVRCLKGGPSVVCGRRSFRQKCKYCTNLHQKCTNLPREFWAESRRLQKAYDKANLAKTPAAYNNANRLARAFSREIDAFGREHRFYNWRDNVQADIAHGIRTLVQIQAAQAGFPADVADIAYGTGMEAKKLYKSLSRGDLGLQRNPVIKGSSPPLAFPRRKRKVTEPRSAPVVEEDGTIVVSSDDEGPKGSRDGVGFAEP